LGAERYSDGGGGSARFDVVPGLAVEIVGDGPEGDGALCVPGGSFCEDPVEGGESRNIWLGLWLVRRSRWPRLRIGLAGSIQIVSEDDDASGDVAAEVGDES
jgi:hypothetical protein